MFAFIPPREVAIQVNGLRSFTALAHAFSEQNRVSAQLWQKQKDFRVERFQLFETRDGVLSPVLKSIDQKVVNNLLVL